MAPDLPGWFPAYLLPEKKAAAAPAPEPVKTPNPAATGNGNGIPAAPQAPPQIANSRSRAAAPTPVPRQAATPAGVEVGQAGSHIRVQYAFDANDDSQVNLKPGDYVEIAERHGSGWAYGKVKSSPMGPIVIEGWFPDWMCDPKFCTPV